MIDLQHEQPLTLSAAAREVPNRTSGRGVSVSTPWRWALRGIRGVRLETIFIGGIRYTSREALQRFFAATTAAANGESIPSRTVNQRERAVADAAAELEAAGI